MSGCLLVYPKNFVNKQLTQHLEHIEYSNIEEISTTTEYFTKEWAKGNSKRQQRYKHFQGSKNTIFVAAIKKFSIPTSTEGDEWHNKSCKKYLMSLKKCLKRLESEKDKPPLREYRAAQKAILRMLCYHNKIDKILNHPSIFSA